MIQQSTTLVPSGLTAGPPYDDLELETRGTRASNSNNNHKSQGIELPPISPLKPYGRKLKGHRRHTYGNQESFRLDYEFKHKLRQLAEPWKGTNGKPDDVVAQIVFERTYQRGGESWAGVIIRVVEGTYNMQLRHFRQFGLPWNFKSAQKSAQEMATRMHVMKFLPPGRGLWAMGSPIIEERHLYAALQNCFRGSEKFITQEYGSVPFVDVVGQSVTVMTEKGWKTALVSQVGYQPVQKVTFVSIGSANDDVDVVVTEDHKWILADATPTTCLSVGDCVLGIAMKSYGENSSYDKKIVWQVKSVSPFHTQEPVYCALVPETGSFFLSSGIHTGNCAFISTENMDRNCTEPFTFLMDASMLGVGVGWDTKGAGKVRVHEPLGTPDQPGKFDLYVVEDSRHGWVESIRLLLESYLRPKKNVIQFDYTEIRPKGVPLKGFGGVSSGHEPLMVLHESARKILQQYVGKPINSRFIADIMNLIGACVVSGNIRRTAEIGFGDPNDIAFMDLKDYEKNPERAAFGWTSNNSILATVGIDYTEIAKRMVKNGEPGLGWIDNMRSYGRMCDPRTDKDARIAGANPCMEMGLEPHELCNLVETFPFKHDSLPDYLRTLKFAFLYAKTVTLECTHMPKTNEVMMRNRRIGTSVTGVTQFIAKHGIDKLRIWLDSGYKFIQDYDKRLSELFCIPRSVKTTTVKPSGTVSLLAGATPGMHFPIMQCYIRRITISNSSHLYEKLEKAGYDIEPKFICTNVETGEDINDKSSSIVSCPVYLGDECKKTEETVSMWEQLSLTAFLQRFWADNQVSCTVKFDPITEGPQLVAALEYFQYHLKGISFLPKNCDKYRQAPYEAISHEKYLEMVAKLKPLNFDSGSSSGSSFLPTKPESEDDEDDFIFARHCEPEDEEEPKEEEVQSLVDVLPDGLNFCDGDQCQRE